MDVHSVLRLTGRDQCAGHIYFSRVPPCFTAFYYVLTPVCPFHKDFARTPSVFVVTHAEYGVYKCSEGESYVRKVTCSVSTVFDCWILSPVS